MRSTAQPRSSGSATIHDVGNRLWRSDPLEQIVNNLSRKPSNSRSVRLPSRFTVCESEQAYLTIRDKGRGIEPEALKQVFERLAGRSSSPSQLHGSDLGCHGSKH